MKEEEIKRMVREGYAGIARGEGSCCAPSSCGCQVNTAEDTSRKRGYRDEEVSSTPEGANLGLGCGNPIALASLKEGETVLDLGSGAGPWNSGYRQKLLDTGCLNHSTSWG